MRAMQTDRAMVATGLMRQPPVAGSIDGAPSAPLRNVRGEQAETVRFRPASLAHVVPRPGLHPAPRAVPRLAHRGVAEQTCVRRRPSTSLAGTYIGMLEKMERISRECVRVLERHRVRQRTGWSIPPGPFPSNPSVQSFEAPGAKAV
jgi:hypothetical protein